MIKKSLSIFAVFLGIIFSLSAFAGERGFYVTARAGASDTHGLERKDGADKLILGSGNTFTYAGGTLTGNSADVTGLAGGFDFGYQLCQYLAFETSFRQYAEAKWKDTGGRVADNREYSLQLTAKGIMPLPMGFNVNAKLGPAYVNSNFDPDNNFTINGTNIKSAITRRRLHRYTWVWGVGAGYEIVKDLSVDLSVERVEGHGEIQKIDFASVGLTYNFG